jgi:hypothetical protein
MSATMAPTVIWRRQRAGGHFWYDVASKRAGDTLYLYDEHQELDVLERLYRERGYHPPFEELPWVDETANKA